MCSTKTLESVALGGTDKLVRAIAGRGVGGFLAPKAPISGLLSGTPTDALFKKVLPGPAKSPQVDY